MRKERLYLKKNTSRKKCQVMEVQNIVVILSTQKVFKSFRSSGHLVVLGVEHH